MDNENFLVRMFREAARRQNLPLPETLDLPVFGVRPRLGAILDRLNPAQNPRHLTQAEPLAIGPYLFHPADSRLEHDGMTTRLTEKERDILLMLFDAGGETVDRRMLLDAVWGYADGVETHTLETHIYRLRQKIEQDPAQPLILLTRDDGYALAMI